MIPLGLYDLICLWLSLTLTLEKLDFWSHTLVKMTKFFFDAYINTNIFLTRTSYKKLKLSSYSVTAHTTFKHNPHIWKRCI